SRMAFLAGAVLFFGSCVTLRSTILLLSRYTISPQKAAAIGFNSDNSWQQLSNQLGDRVTVKQLDLDVEDPDYDLLQSEDPDFILVNGRRYSGEEIKRLFNFGSRVQIPVRVFPSTDQLFFAQTTKVSWNGNRLLRSRLHYRLQQQMALKTVFDYVFGTVIFFVCIPIFMLVGLLILLLDGPPVLFTQERTGRGGGTFNIYKFRTMVPEAEEKGPSLTDGEEDPRITPLGRWLRRWSLDELPQLWNVLRGEMSLVGPRPEIPSITDDYDSDQERILWLKPGLTGLSQVRGRQQLELDEKLEIDQEYLNDYSLGLDLWILMKTVLAVIRGRGTA
ncbi:MAG: sugar transferase, partial [bacterium]